MVLLPHAGFGVRDREIMMYFWDMRDGPDWSGWWVTPDYMGNNEFILHNRTDDDSPTTASSGAWRSVHIEDIQLKRKLDLGFKATADGTLTACGSDASLAISPDGKLTLTFSELEFVPDGMHHGKTAYKARAKKTASVSRDLLSSPVVHVALGVAVGVLATTGLFWLYALRTARR